MAADGTLISAVNLLPKVVAARCNLIEATEHLISNGHVGTIELSGTAVSRGTAVGRAVFLYGNARQFFRLDVTESGTSGELDRLETAIAKVGYELTDLAADSSLGENSKHIFEIQSLILSDTAFSNAIRDTIVGERVNAEWAITNVADIIASKLLSVSPDEAHGRHLDIQDVAERLLNAIGVGEVISAKLPPGSIVVASSIRPSTLVELSHQQARAIVTEQGGWTSHSFIMARDLGIPAVTGIADLRRSIRDGDEIAVDGYLGRVIIRPDTLDLTKLFQGGDGVDIAPPRGHSTSLPPATTDGRKVILRANVEHFESTTELRERGAAGVGLLRSEYIFGQWTGSFPSEKAQADAYRNIAQKAGPDGVKIRTFDLNANQLTGEFGKNEVNPSLGLRAIRLSLAHEDLYREQLRAILTSHVDNNIEIVLPMVSGPDEITRSRDLIDRERERLHALGIDAGDPLLGAMIEVPSSVVMIDEIAALADFVCIGTNDLVQYLLAVDRDNASVSSWYQTLHPAVLRSIRRVIEAAARADIPAVVCGEMAGSPYYTPLLIGMGARELSMNLGSIGDVRRVVSGITYDEACNLAGLVESAGGTRAAEQILADFYREHWPFLFGQTELDRMAAASANSTRQN